MRSQRQSHHLPSSRRFLSAAQDENRDELIDLWAALLATALDPKTQSQYRREFSDSAKQLEPLDATVLRELAALPEMMPSAGTTRATILASRLDRSFGEIALSFAALLRLGLTNDETTESIVNPRLTQKGIQFMRVISPSSDVA
jgi:hypothetical protein